MFYKFSLSLLCVFTRKTGISENNSFFRPYSVRTFARSDNTTSQNIGGTDTWAVPHLKFGGDRPPKSPPMVLTFHVPIPIIFEFEFSCRPTVVHSGSDKGGSC